MKEADSLVSGGRAREYAFKSRIFPCVHSAEEGGLWLSATVTTTKDLEYKYDRKRTFSILVACCLLPVRRTVVKQFPHAVKSKHGNPALLYTQEKKCYARLSLIISTPYKTKWVI